MANKKKTEKVGTISGYELTKKAMPHYVPNFRTGGHMTEKDRPRKKVNKRNMDRYMQKYTYIRAIAQIYRPRAKCGKFVRKTSENSSSFLKKI